MSEMGNVLKELSLETPQLFTERIEPENVSRLVLLYEELSRLGVTTIGDRVRLCGLCSIAERENQSSTQSAASSVLRERMALFSGSRNSRRGDRKRKAAARRTWAVNFICVANRYQSRIPSATEKQLLFHAALGMKKGKLDLEDDERDVVEKITCGDTGNDGENKGFPQIKQCGGFEIMFYVSGCNELKPSNCSWSAKDLETKIGAQ